VNKILVSACLLGQRVRYDGEALTLSDEILQRWLEDGRVVSVCPEVEAGMSVPRPPAEIASGDGYDVLTGAAIVMDNTGIDVSSYFRRGASLALSLCRENNITLAVLAESSPSCGSSTLHDGSFSGSKISGVGVTTALLKQNGIAVYNQYEIAAADKLANAKLSHPAHPT
jgi:uncharacterized protein YbbK (DUF523 family)